VLCVFKVSSKAIHQLPVGVVPKSGDGTVRVGECDRGLSLGTLGQPVVDLVMLEIRCSVFCCKEGRGDKQI